MADPKKKDDYPVSFSWHERGGRKSDDEFDPRRDPERPDDWAFPEVPAGISPAVLRKVAEMLQRQAKKPEGLESGAVEPVYPLETMALSAGGGAAGKELVKLAARKIIERMMRGTGQGPGMQTMEGSGMYTAAPRNARVRQFDRAMYDIETRLGMQHNVNRRPHNPAGSNKPLPLSPGEIQNMWNRLNPNNQMIGTARVNQVRDINRPFYQTKPPYSAKEHEPHGMWYRPRRWNQYLEQMRQ